MAAEGGLWQGAYDEADVSDKPAWLRSVPRVGQEGHDQVASMFRRQADTLMGVDAGVDRVLRAWAQHRDLGNTIVVYLGDNGYSWGDHRLPHKRYPYPAINSVPLWVKYPEGVGPPPGEDPRLATNVDVTRTILDLARADLPDTAGVSLLSPDPRPDMPLEALPFDNTAGDLVAHPAFCGTRTLTRQYVLYATGDEEFYLLDKDPDTLDNRAADPAFGPEVGDLRARALAECAGPHPPFALDQPPTGNH
jgi:arylsulfatase A-like enzyme